MNLTRKEIDQFVQLEESLWIADTRFDMKYMEQILHAEFIEFGCSGRRYTRDDTLDITGTKIQIKLPFDNLKIQRMSKTVVQVTYISEVQYDTLQVCNRSSIWLYHNDRWQLYFHQGTAIHR